MPKANDPAETPALHDITPPSPDTVEESIGLDVSKARRNTVDGDGAPDPVEEDFDPELASDAEAVAEETPAAEAEASADPDEAVEEEGDEVEQATDDTADPYAALEQQENERLAQLRRDKADALAELGAVDGDDFDIIDNGPKVLRAQAKLIKTQDAESAILQQRAERQNQRQQTESYWSKWDRANKELRGEGRKLYEDTYRKELKRTGNAAAAQQAAIVELKVMERTKAKPAPAAAAPEPRKGIAPKNPKPINRTAGRITPVAGGRVPPPKARTIEQRLRQGMYGNIANVGG